MPLLLRREERIEDPRELVGGDAGAVVGDTTIVVASTPRRASTRTCLPPAAAASAALRTRFHSTWRSFAGSACSGSGRSTVERHVDVGERRSPRATCRVSSTSTARSKSTGCGRPRVRVVEQVADQHVEPLDLAVDDRHQRAIVVGRLRAPGAAARSIRRSTPAGCGSRARRRRRAGRRSRAARRAALGCSSRRSSVRSWKLIDPADHLVAHVAQRRDRDADGEVGRELRGRRAAARRARSRSAPTGRASARRSAGRPARAAAPRMSAAALLAASTVPSGAIVIEPRRQRAHDVLVQREQIGRGLAAWSPASRRRAAAGRRR